MVMHNFHGLKSTTFYCVADIAYFWPSVTEIIFSLNVTSQTSSKTLSKTGKRVPNTACLKSSSFLYSTEIGWPTLFNSLVSFGNYTATCSVAIKKTAGRCIQVCLQLFLHSASNFMTKISGNLSQDKFICTVRKFCGKSQLIHGNTAKNDKI